MHVSVNEHNFHSISISSSSLCAPVVAEGRQFVFTVVQIFINFHLFCLAFPFEK